MDDLLTDDDGEVIVDSVVEDGLPLELTEALQSDFPKMSADQRTRLNEIARALRAGESVPQITVRFFLSWFWDTQRRGRWIVTYIRAQLEKAGLRTSPDFESTYLDAQIAFVLLSQHSDQDRLEENATVEVAELDDFVEAQPDASTVADPTYRISKLASANQKPIAVKPDNTLAEAITIMMANDFSQLPVMISDREVKGIVSWESIGSRLALGQTPKWVREVMSNHAEISSEASLFTAIPVIVEHGYALVRSGIDRSFVGIITTSDLSLQFQQLSEPFLLLGEIENHLRRIISPKFNAEQLATLKDPLDSARLIRSVSDLAFGEYKRLLEDPTKWEALDLNLDRGVFVQLLDKVRKTRNEVMHFDPDGIEDKSLADIRDFARLLRTLRTIGAT